MTSKRKKSTDIALKPIRADTYEPRNREKWKIKSKL